jgi:hypothetical protein
MGNAPRRRGALAIVALGLVMQVFVAAGALTGDRPARYGWQMYSAAVEMPRLWVVDGEEEREVSLIDTLVQPRGDIDWAALVRERGCDLVDAEAIRYELADGTRATLECE